MSSVVFDPIHESKRNMLVAGWGWALGGVLLVAVAGLSLREEVAQDAQPEHPVSPWALVWRDEFDGQVLDATKWAVRAPGLRESAMISAENVSLDGAGRLLLTTTEKDGVIHTGMIGSQGKFSHTYGRWEARIKFHAMEGHHGSFWLQPERREKDVGNNPHLTGAEIDIIEWFGAGRKDGGAASNVYWPGEAGQHLHDGGPLDLTPVLKDGRNLSDDFHVYAVEWTPDEYVFFIDEHEVFRTRAGVSRQPQYAILSLLCADWEAPRLDRSRLPESMMVDYVRVYRMRTAAVAVGPSPRAGAPSPVANSRYITSRE
ncbi:glycoside hydrolase family 16 protein [Verrucomicrobium spinosum]|uniref:glycoside hydrolase family 16 protein n=2 Tax=Verrucomicrobium spinosum TaxID=2736 RepID=UPI0012E32316|nr:glycoside hydrolase family 16 protein [Verrucomicrobium spinosum]